MNSRINKNPKHIYECFLEVVRPQEHQEKPWILQSYPTTYKDSDDERLKSVPQFTFPCTTQVSQVQHFSFVLTSIEAQWTYGFVRYSPNSDTAFCILSYLPWHELFYKVLNQSANIIQSSGDLELFLSSVYSSRLPVPGLTFSVSWGESVFTGATPNTLYLPSIPENRNLTEYYNAVETNLMIAVFASMLHERRIIITCTRLSALSACVQAANTLIYPMFWQHIFIPVLPAHLMDYLSAPMPFLIGVPQPLFQRIKMSELGDVVIVDVDARTFESPFNDVDNLPQEILYNLRKSLSPSRDHLGDTVARAFLVALVHLIGGYRAALKYRQGGKVSFSDEEFIKSRSSSLQPFLSEMLQLQIFRQFVDERLELLNAGKGFSDQFELECVSFDPDKFSKKSKSYAAINNVKKEGAAAFKAVKEKANPAVKHAVKSVRDGGKIAKIKVKESYKDAKSRFKDGKEEMRDDSSVHSAPSSPTSRRASNIGSNSSILTRNNTDMNFGRVLKYEKFDPPDRRDLSPEFEEIPKLDYVDIMSSIEEVMSRNKSEDAALRTHMIKSEAQLPSVSSNNVSNVVRAEPVQERDLISLDTESLVFDPLLENSTAAGNQNLHKKLERASAGSIHEPRKHSVGKYENHVPAGGAQHREFQDFMSTMTAPVSSSSNSRRSEDQSLHDFGIDFNNLSVSRSNGVSAANYNHPPPVPPRSNNNSFLHNNINNYSHNYISNNIPVNHRISSTIKNVPEREDDVFADLDPLRSSNNSQQLSSTLPSSHQHQNQGSPFPPAPQVPPRTKKQWTTFD